MRFVVRQRIFSFGDSFTIKDEHGNDHFVVKGRVFTLGNKLRIYDMAGQELYYIEQKILRFLPEYTIYQSGRPMAKVKKEFTFFKPRFNINSTLGNFTIQGNFLGMNFSILKNGEQVAEVSKRWFSFSDTYGVDIKEGEDYGFLLALVIVIDQVLHDNNHNNN
ncbi:MAG TPA: LURP-one-related family protein [Clostridia bacterium]|nr:LURP-one-related family protein [Clostridia bacterium]